MSNCDQTTTFGPYMIKTSTTNEANHAITGFFPIADGASVSAEIKTISMDANVQVELGVQLAATRTDEPSAPTALGSAITSVTETGITATVSASGQAYARLVLIVQRTTSGSEARVEVAGSVTVHQCARVLAAIEFSLPPVLGAAAGTPTADEAWVVPVGPFFPTAGGPSLKLVVLGRDIQNPSDMRVQMVTRTAVGREAPDAWALAQTGGWDTPSASNAEWNTGEETPTVTSKAWLQAGVAFARANGGGVVSGDFKLILIVVK